jgi:hypothetical protein
VLRLLIAASEPSKTAWYIAGSALAVYAVVLSAIGLSRPSFPYGERGARAVMLVSLVFVGVAIAMAIVTG